MNKIPVEWDILTARQKDIAKRRAEGESVNKISEAHEIRKEAAFQQLKWIADKLREAGCDEKKLRKWNLTKRFKKKDDYQKKLAGLGEVNTIGKRLKELRLRKEMSVKKLANKTGIHWQRIHIWERDEEVPSLDYLVKYLEGLGLGLGSVSGTPI